MASLRRIEGADGRVVLHDVSVRYGRRLALEAVSGEFPSGSMTAVVGANGAGKSTLLMAITGIVPLARGSVTRGARQHLAYLPQHAAIDREYPLTLSELIVLGGAGTSFTPSPVTATISPEAFNARTRSSFWAGMARATTSNSISPRELTNPFSCSPSIILGVSPPRPISRAMAAAVVR